MDQLQLATSLFDTLEAKDVAYIHWKSNEHLHAAVRGQTDLDLLVPPEHRDDFRSIVDSLGFVTMLSPEVRRVPGLESFLGFDESTGSLLHLDVHYRLVLGEQLIKNHHLPIEGWLLADPGRLEGVRIPPPGRELLLLYVRAMLKMTGRQLLRSIVKGGSPLPERIQTEATWLADQVGESELTEAAETVQLGITSAEVAEFHRRAQGRNFDWRYVLGRKRSLRKRLRRHERLPRHRAVPKAMWLRFRSTRLAKRLGWGIPPRRLQGPAPLVAAVGADGAGKSRLTKDLERWLGWKLTVRHVYFGQPKTGVLFKLLNKPGSMARAQKKASGPLAGIARLTDSLKWVILANQRRRLATDARKRAQSGEVVIAERYPLPEFRSMTAPMDGPRLQDASGTMARRELRAYDTIETPDLVLVLQTDLGTLRDRKLDLTIEEHTAKVEAVRHLTPGPGRAIIDAGPPYERVLLEAKTAIWKAIRESR
ncbi:MAG TPA: hypothetical protein VJA46_06830 [Acidimicrobiia bacterium]|nr:hypothetical protein [Acidimicrobiia bacterium]